MSLLTARARAHALRQAKAEEAQPGTIVIKLGANTSSPIVCAIEINENAPRPTDAGQMQRIEPCVVHVRKALLPAWATVDAMAGKAKLTTDDKTFKVSGARDLGHTLRLSCIRWPDDGDGV